MSSVVRVPDQIHLESKRLAALRGLQPGDVLADAWREYIQKHREQFAADLETAARLMREGTPEQLAAFASRNAKADASAAVKRLKKARIPG